MRPDLSALGSDTRIRGVTSFLSVAVAVLGFVLLARNASAQDKFVQITVEETRVRTAPTSEGQFVVRAAKGDVFEWVATHDQWFEVYLSSGAARFLPDTAATLTMEVPPVPPSETERKRIAMAMVRAADRATCEALRRYPKEIEQQITYERLLQDRYQLRVFQDHGFPAARYDSLKMEGARKSVSGEWQLPSVPC